MEKNDIFFINLFNLTQLNSTFPNIYTLAMNNISPSKLAFLIISGIVIVIGITANSIIIFTIIRYRFMRNSTNLFLLNLAIADIMVLGFNLPWTMVNYTNSNWVYGNFLCKLNPMIQYMALSLGIFSLVSISVKRFFVLRNSNSRYSKRKIGCWILALWLLSFLSSFPVLKLYHVVEVRLAFTANKIDMKRCTENSAIIRREIYSLCVFTGLFLVPLSLMIIFYGRLSYILLYSPSNHQKVKFVNGTTVSEQNETSQPCNSAHLSLHMTTERISQQNISSRRLQAVRLMIMLLVNFAVCWLPYHVVSLYLDFQDKENNKVSGTSAMAGQQISHFWYTGVVLFAFTNSLTNPILLLFMSSQFQRCTKRMFDNLVQKLRRGRREQPLPN